MFKNLLQFWKGKDFLKQVFEDFKSMLEAAETMFNLVRRRLIENEKIPGLEGRIYEIDRQINDFQKEIRKRVVEHLTIQPSVDVATSLLLMSVVKDAERLGDYAKNLLEVANLLEKPINKKSYTGLFNGIDSEILELFRKTKRAFLESDEDKAAESWSFEKDIVRRCDDVINKLAKSRVSVNEGVCFTLMARHFKRIAAHLTNIATSVILPISDLDYFDERREEK